MSMLKTDNDINKGNFRENTLKANRSVFPPVICKPGYS